MKGFNLSTGGGAAGSVSTPLGPGGVPSLHSLSSQVSNPPAAKKSSLTIADASIDMKKSPMQR